MKNRASTIIAAGLAGLTLGVIAIRLGGYTGLWIYLPLVTAAVGGLLGTRPAARNNAGLVLGGAFGLFAWDIAVAHYLSRRTQLDESEWLLGATVGVATGVSIALVARARRDPLSVGTIATLSLAAHVMARLWLEDYPTWTGTAALVVGAGLGYLLARAPWFRDARGIVLGIGAGAACAQFIALPILASTGTLWRWPLMYPQTVLGSLVVMGALAGWAGREMDGYRR